MSRPRIWIVDGHNLIFQLPGLEELQASGRRAQARRSLEAALREFARSRAEPVLVVYDGNEQHSNPELVQEDLLHTTYSSGASGEQADDRIVYLARHHAEQGTRVSVVTSDVRTLGRDLPEGTDRMDAVDFYRLHLLPRAQPDRKPVDGDFSDVEAEFLRRDREDRPVRPVAPRPAARPLRPPAGPAQRVPAAPSATDEIRAEQRRRKKERGRLRQQRRLRRYRPKG